MYCYKVSPKLWLKLLKDGRYLRVTTATLTRRQGLLSHARITVRYPCLIYKFGY